MASKSLAMHSIASLNSEEYSTYLQKCCRTRRSEYRVDMKPHPHRVVGCATPDHTTPHRRSAGVVWFVGVVKNFYATTHHRREVGYTIDVRSSRLKPQRASAKICLSAWVTGDTLDNVDTVLRAKTPADRMKKIDVTL